MTRGTIALSLVAATLALGACGYDDHDRGYGGYGYGGGNGGGGNGYPSGNQQALLEVLHASPDAPPVNVLLDGQILFDATTSHTLAVQAQTPGAPTTVIGPLTESFAADTVYTVVAEGPVASLGPVVFSHPQSAIAPSTTRVQVLHAASAAPSVAVYLTAPGAALASSAPVATFAFKGSVGPTDIPAGDYEIRVTPAGAVTPVLFDSGTITLEPGEDLLLAAVQNTGPGSAPIAIATVDQNGRNQLLLDVATPATVRVVHDIADAPAIAVLANGIAPPLVASLAFPNFTAYLPETPGQYTLAVTPATNTGDVLLEQAVNLSAGSQHSVYALGGLATPSALVTRDDDRRIATQAQLKIIHGSPSAGPVDVYLVPTGASITAAAPTFASVPFGGDTGFQGVAAGAYDVIITPAGSKTPAIGPVAVTLKDSGIYTAVARDAAGGGTPLGLILLDDFAG